MAEAEEEEDADKVAELRCGGCRCCSRSRRCGGGSCVCRGAGRVALRSRLSFALLFWNQTCTLLNVVLSLSARTCFSCLDGFGVCLYASHKIACCSVVKRILLLYPGSWSPITSSSSLSSVGELKVTLVLSSSSSLVRRSCCILFICNLNVHAYIPSNLRLYSEKTAFCLIYEISFYIYIYHFVTA